MPGPHASVSCCANSGNPCSRQPPRPHQLPPARNLPRPKNSPRGCFCPAVRWTQGPGFSIPTRVTFYARHLLKSVYKEKSTTSNEVVLFGDPQVSISEPFSLKNAMGLSPSRRFRFTIILSSKTYTVFTKHSITCRCTLGSRKSRSLNDFSHCTTYSFVSLGCELSSSKMLICSSSR